MTLSKIPYLFFLFFSIIHILVLIYFTWLHYQCSIDNSFSCSYNGVIILLSTFIHIVINFTELILFIKKSKNPIHDLFRSGLIYLNIISSIFIILFIVTTYLPQGNIYVNFFLATYAIYPLILNVIMLYQLKK